MAEASAAALLRTPLYDEHLACKARMCGFGGWDMPLTYEGQLVEHKAVRTGVGMFDVSHMGQVRFTGKDALNYLQHLVPADIGALRNGQSKYTQLVNERGGCVDDLIISKLADEEYFAVVNASTRPNDVRWMRAKRTEMNADYVKIEDESDKWGMIAVQGPRAFEILNKLIHGEWEKTPALTMHHFTHDGQPHLLSRTGYTGEVGAEILCPAELTAGWWRILLAEGVTPCGLASRDSLRLEAGYCLYGSDLDMTTSPVEAGLSWSVGWKKVEQFTGRAVLEKQKANGAPRKLIGLKIQGRKPLRHGDVILGDGEPIGDVTSGGYSPMLECGIAMGYVETGAEVMALSVETKTAPLHATLVKPPFVKTSLSK
ncbi:glycine cleavage system aminomethyltransferase GcvT [soil metagenome]